MADLQRSHDAVNRCEEGLEQVGGGMLSTTVTSVTRCDTQPGGSRSHTML